MLLGPVATGLAIVAIGFLGYQALTGHLPVRRAMRVVLGCFVLFGAPTIAAALLGLAGQTGETPLPAPQASPAPTLDPALFPRQLNGANPFDPYAAAAAPN